MFPRHFDLAEEFKKPMYFSFLNPFDKTMWKVIQDKRNKFPGGIVRNYDSSKSDIFSVLDTDLYIGLNHWSIGGQNYDIIKQIPLNRVIIEEKCPFCRLVLYDPKHMPGPNEE